MSMYVTGKETRYMNVSNVSSIITYMFYYFTDFWTVYYM